MSTTHQTPTALDIPAGSALLSRCAQAIRDLDRITAHPLSAEDQAGAVLAVVLPKRPTPAACHHTAGFWQFEGETYCRTCGENEERCKPNAQGQPTPQQSHE